MIELPALRGDHALGFLAAVGLSALSEQGEIPELRLSWTRDASPVAVIEGDASSRSELIEALEAALARLRSSGAALPGVDASFPVPKKGSGTDPMRTKKENLAPHFSDAAGRWLEGDEWPAWWVIALCGQYVERETEDVSLTPFYAPTGQMSLRNSIFEASMQAAEKVGGPGDALLAWRRISKYDGANFEERAKRDAGVTTWGHPDNKGAPSPTWLAAMGMRMFPVVEAENRSLAVGWQRVSLYPGYTRRSLVWPTWEPPLDAAAVRVLLGHPAMRLQERATDVQVRRPDQLPGLGVTGVFGASRRTSTQGDGPLGPAVRIWPPRSPGMGDGAGVGVG